MRYEPCDITLDRAIKTAQTSRPEFQLAEVKVEEAKQNVKLVKKSYFPQLTIEGQYQIGGSHPTSNYGYNYGGYLNFPTINGMLIKNEIKEAQALYSREQSNAINTKNNIYYEIQESYYSLTEKKNKTCKRTKYAKPNISRNPKRVFDACRKEKPNSGRNFAGKTGKRKLRTFIWQV